MAKKNIEGKIWQLENQLETALRPVSPRPEYRSYLHDRLVEARVTPARKRLEFSPAVGLYGSRWVNGHCRVDDRRDQGAGDVVAL
jgi:hypothetical protein